MSQHVGGCLPIKTRASTPSTEEPTVYHNPNASPPTLRAEGSAQARYFVELANMIKNPTTTQELLYMLRPLKTKRKTPKKTFKNIAKYQPTTIKNHWKKHGKTPKSLPKCLPGPHRDPLWEQASIFTPFWSLFVDFGVPREVPKRAKILKKSLLELPRSTSGEDFL